MPPSPWVTGIWFWVLWFAAAIIFTAIVIHPLLAKPNNDTNHRTLLEDDAFSTRLKEITQTLYPDTPPEALQIAVTKYVKSPEERSQICSQCHEASCRSNVHVAEVRRVTNGGIKHLRTSGKCCSEKEAMKQLERGLHGQWMRKKEYARKHAGVYIKRPMRRSAAERLAEIVVQYEDGETGLENE